MQISKNCIQNLRTENIYFITFLRKPKMNFKKSYVFSKTHFFVQKFIKNFRQKFRKKLPKKCKNLSFFVHFCKIFKDFLKTFMKVGIHNFKTNIYNKPLLQ